MFFFLIFTCNYKKWKEEHSKILQSQLNPSLQKSSCFPLIKSKNQMDKERVGYFLAFKSHPFSNWIWSHFFKAVYESAKIEILSCSQFVPCIACQTECMGKRHEIIIRPPKLRSNIQPHLILFDENFSFNQNVHQPNRITGV